MRRGITAACIIFMASVSLYALLMISEKLCDIRAEASSGGMTATGSVPAKTAAKTASASSCHQGDLSLRYESLPEEGYDDETWEELYTLYPYLSEVSSLGRYEGIERMYLPYYSTTVSYGHDNVFGAWEFAYFDEESEAFVSLGVYSYVRELYEDGRPKEGEAGEYRWRRFSEPEAGLYFPDFYTHMITASLINGNTLRLHIKVDCTDNMGGTWLFVTYELHTRDARNLAGVFTYPYYSVDDATAEQPRLGTMTYNSYENHGSSSSGERYLKMDVYWDLSGEDLIEFMEDLENDKLYWACGAHGSGSNSIYGASITVDNIGTYAKQASCSHDNKSYTKIANDTSKHKISCADCGADLGTEAHAKSGGTCTKCGYVFTVSGRLIYVLNGRTETENYTKNPNTTFTPKTFTGYKTPAAVTVPSGGGDIRINYEPISYELDLSGRLQKLKYDEEFRLPVIERKGYTHEGYYYV